MLMWMMQSRRHPRSKSESARRGTLKWTRWCEAKCQDCAIFQSREEADERQGKGSLLTIHNQMCRRPACTHCSCTWASPMCECWLISRYAWGGGYYLHSLVFTCTCIHRIKHILFPEYILISVTMSRAPLRLLSNCVILMTFLSKDRRERVGSYLVMWQHKSTSNCSFVAVAAALENSV